MAGVRVVPTEFSTDGERLVGDFLIPEGEGPFPGICKLHGLPGSADQIHGIAWALAQTGFIVLTFDFRGFRRSEGVFSLSGEIEDAQSAISHLRDHELVDSSRIGVMGASFGGAVAICTAAIDRRVDAICVRAPVYDTMKFTKSALARDIVESVALTFPGEMHGTIDSEMRQKIIQGLHRDSERHNPIDLVDRLSPRPLFIISGDMDMLIDVQGVTNLFERALEPKEIAIIHGADHNLEFLGPRIETEDRILSWFNQNL